MKLNETRFVCRSVTRPQPLFVASFHLNRARSSRTGRRIDPFALKRNQTEAEKSSRKSEWMEKEEK